MPPQKNFQKITHLNLVLVVKLARKSVPSVRTTISEDYHINNFIVIHNQ